MYSGVVHKIVSLEDEAYPTLLKEISNPPLALFIKGELDLNARPVIAIVGTRHVTNYGREAAQYFAEKLAKAGFLVVSGFMYGVDAIVHQTVIDVGGHTAAVLGFGFDHMYPVSHKELAERMLNTGQVLISEYEPWRGVEASNFPARNRIVTGMSLGVVVIEAGSRSGSKISARLAAEQGREVFAVPGPFNSPFSEGTKELINLGAKLVNDIGDILEEIPT